MNGLYVVILASLLAAPAVQAESFDITGNRGSHVTADVVASFNSPWAMTFLPDDSMLVTTRPGILWQVEANGRKHRIAGLPEISIGGQGGLGDIILHPQFETNAVVFLSYVESKDDVFGAAVARATLDLIQTGGGSLTGLTVIWRQRPKLANQSRYSHRLTFGPEGSVHGTKLFITSGDRRSEASAQDMKDSLGKIIRINEDGTVPTDNPWQDAGKPARKFWSIGHRNVLGIAFDGDGSLWIAEMGPRHGDELNLIEPGKNYGWPLVSEGNDYSGKAIPQHETRPDFEAPVFSWTPAIAPSGLVIYSGDHFPTWSGDAFIGGLVSRALIRIELENDSAVEAERFEWGSRVREVEVGPKGALWVLEDRDDLLEVGGGGRLLRVTAARH